MELTKSQSEPSSVVPSLLTYLGTEIAALLRRIAISCSILFSFPCFPPPDSHCCCPPLRCWDLNSVFGCVFETIHPKLARPPPDPSSAERIVRDCNCRLSVALPLSWSVAAAAAVGKNLFGSSSAELGHKTTTVDYWWIESRGNGACSTGGRYHPS